MSNFRCVIIIDKNLPSGLVANTAAILSLSVGSTHPNIVGPDISDRDNNIHRGITTIPVPILAADSSNLWTIREATRQHENELTVIDFTSAAQTTKTYDEYSKKISSLPTSELNYLGIAISGKSKLVNKYTGNLPLLR